MTSFFFEPVFCRPKVNVQSEFVPAGKGLINVQYFFPQSQEQIIPFPSNRKVCIEINIWSHLLPTVLGREKAVNVKD